MLLPTTELSDVGNKFPLFCSFVCNGIYRFPTEIEWQIMHLKKIFIENNYLFMPLYIYYTPDQADKPKEYKISHSQNWFLQLHQPQISKRIY